MRCVADGAADGAAGGVADGAAGGVAGGAAFLDEERLRCAVVLLTGIFRVLI